MIEINLLPRRQNKIVSQNNKNFQRNISAEGFRKLK